MNDLLQGDERLDYLLAESLRIIQSPTVFSFSLDAVLLANFINVPHHKGSIVDLCTGNGVIPLLLSTRTAAKITGVELQERLFSMAERSINYNNLQTQITMLHDDVKTVAPTLGIEKHDAVTCNPPYFLAHEQSERNANEYLTLARHEITLTLDEAVHASSRLLKQGGKAAFVHRPGRLIDITASMRAHNIEPKRIQLVYPKMGKEANILLVEGIKYGKPDLKIMPPLYVYDDTGEYTPTVRKMLRGE